MVSDYGYTTVAKVGTRLRTTFDGTTIPTDTEVETIISEQESRINSYAGKRFDQHTVTNELYDHDGSSVILTKDPLVSVTTLEYTDDNGDSWTTVQATDYIVDTDYSRIERKVGGSSNTHEWPRVSGQQAVRLTYEAGYSSPPSRITSLATDMAALGVIRTLLNSQSNEEGGDIQVGPIEIGESKLLQNPGFIRNMRESVEKRLSKLSGPRSFTTVGKSWKH